MLFMRCMATSRGRFRVADPTLLEPRRFSQGSGFARIALPGPDGEGRDVA